MQTAYSCFPSEIKEAVINPLLSNANNQNFFESSLWRREKMICISKMRKGEAQNLNMDPQLPPENSQLDQEKLNPLEKSETFIVTGSYKSNKKIKCPPEIKKNTYLNLFEYFLYRAR